MSPPELLWLDLVAEVVGEFDPNERGRELLTRRYRETSNHEIDRGQFHGGVTRRRVKDMIRRSLADLT